MKRILVFIIISLSYFTVFAQEGDKPAPHMAFYGVDDDTAFHKRDTIFRVDSSHITIFGSAAVAFNTSMGALLNPAEFTYNSTHITPGTAFSFGFNYLSKIHNNHWFFTLGFEASIFNCSGTIGATESQSWPGWSPPGQIDTSTYTISVISLNVPFRMYYRFLETKKCRLSLGAGVSLGMFISQANSQSNSDFPVPNQDNINNLGSLSLRIEFALSKHTWISLEPYYSIQMFNTFTHLESAGVKIELL